ncbi:MAG: peptidylprolyl isomerase [Planctomycetota bacterium]|nr:peptidylprolyl isomerase [Planctomycetota bacterium]MDA1249672.1 peptidylprolyl isomerase [Planctomycetota bacterium]
MALRSKLTTRLYLGCIALALASTGMSCNQNTTEVPPIQTGGPEAVEVADPYSVLFETTKGNFTVEVHPDWSPNGASRFRELIEIGYFDQCRFFRVLPGFMVQWGMSGDPKMNSQWGDNNIPDDPVKKSNTRGYMTFAKTGMPNSRSTQLFINYGNNASLDSQGFSPFAIVTDGMNVVDGINSEYGERPDQGMITRAGNQYLTQNFPRLDYILKASIVKSGGRTANKPVTDEGSGGDEKPEAASSEEPVEPSGE